VEPGGDAAGDPRREGAVAAV